MHILGIDPGLSATGYGVLEFDEQSDNCNHVAHGVIRTKSSQDLTIRLQTIRDSIAKIIYEYSPFSGAIEGGFVGTNARSALTLGHARAIAILALGDGNLKVHEYSPNTVKQTVVGYGKSTKQQVAEMVRLQLNLEQLPKPEDASDALAIAITHWAYLRSNITESN